MEQFIAEINLMKTSLQNFIRLLNPDLSFEQTQLMELLLADDIFAEEARQIEHEHQVKLQKQQVY